MSQWYKKYEDHTLDYQGKKYFEKSFVIKRMDNLLSTAEQYQSRAHAADKLLMKISNNWIVRLLFGRKIRKYLEEYKNIKLKF